VSPAGGVETAMTEHPDLVGGLNIAGGACTNRAVADSLGLEFTEPLEVVGIA